MADKFTDKIKMIMEKSETNKITIYTEHLKIDGTVFECSKCNSNEILNLTNVLVCRLDDYCTCDDDECGCNDYVCFRQDWLHINVNSIVAFSFIKD